MSLSRANKPIIAACMAQFIESFSLNFALGFLTLFIYKELGVGSLAEAALWAGTAQFLMASSLALMSPVWGWFCDRIGGKRMLVRVLIAHTVILGLLSASTSVYQVLVLRLIQGIAGGSSTVIMAIIASSVDKDRLPQAIGYQQSAQTAGQLLGPAVGGVMASVAGLRLSLLASSIMMFTIVPITLWARFEEREKSCEVKEIIHWKDFKGVGRDFVGLFSIQAAFMFIAPIVPVYLAEAGMSGDSLMQYNGIILAMSSLAYAASVPISTRIFKRKFLPLLLAIASGVVFAQGLFRQVSAFLALRTIQCFLHSAGPAFLLGEGGKRDSGKGLAMGILNSARYLGNAVGPFLSSGVAYATNLSMAFTVSASVSLLAAIITIPRREQTSNPSPRCFAEEPTDARV